MDIVQTEGDLRPMSLARSGDIPCESAVKLQAPASTRGPTLQTRRPSRPAALLFPQRLGTHAAPKRAAARDSRPGTGQGYQEGTGQDQAALPLFVLRSGMDAAFRGETEV